MIQTIENPNQYYITEITSTSSNTFLANARDTLGQTAIVEITESGAIQAKTNWTYNITGRPLEYQGKIYFEASYNGVDNLYFLENDELVELTAEGSGKYSPTIDPSTGQIYFTAFSLNGLQLRKVEVPDDSEPFQVVPELNTLAYYNPDFILNPSKIPTADTLRNVEISTYKNTNSLINIHSWTPTVSQTELGFEFTSENVLNTLDLNAGWNYNLNEERSGFDVNATYGQYFVQVNAFFQNLDRSITTNSQNISFGETRTGLGLIVPLNYSSKTYSRNLRLSSDYSFRRIDSKSSELKNQDFHTLTNGLTYRQSKLKARKNIFPKLALSTFIEDSRAINSENYQFTAQNAIALPGLSKNDNLVIEADLRFEGGESNYRNSDQFVYSRGFSSFRSSEMYKVSSNYHFPILYPDMGAFGIFYLLLIRGNAFYDYSIATTQNREFNSAGFELILDTRLFRLLSVPIGVRYSYAFSQTNYNLNNWEVFIPV